MITQCKLENTPDNIKQFLNKWPQPKQLAMEATYNWGLYFDTTETYVDRFMLGHPAKMRAITESESKCDRHDAKAIAHLAMIGYLPKAYIPTKEARDLRSLVRLRSFFIRQRVAIRNKTQALLDRNIWPSERPPSFKNIYCKRGIKWMKELNLPVKERFILDELLKSFEQLNIQIQTVDSYVETTACDMPAVKCLRTVPGLRNSKIHLYTILFEIDDVQRFPRARDLIRYAGLIPSEHSSGEKQRTGHLIQRANHALRTALIESAFSAVLADKHLKAYYRQTKERNNSSAAIVACARKLGYAIYHVLKEQRAFRPFPPVAAPGPFAV